MTDQEERLLQRRVEAMLDDIRDALATREHARRGSIVVCECGAYTICKPCSACERKKLLTYATKKES